MSSSKQKDELIPVINKEARVVQVAYYADTNPSGVTDEEREQYARTMGAPLLTKREVKKLKLLPGLNFVLESELKRSGLLSDVGNPIDAYRGAVEIRDVSTMSEVESVSLAGITTSRQSLIAWLASESRPRVKQAINKRLSSARLQGRQE